MWGALVGLFIFLETLAGSKLEIFANAEAKTFLVLINLLTLGIGIYLSLREYKQQNGGAISFGRCMFNGLLISALAGIITSVGSTIYYKYIVPDVLEKSMIEAEAFFVHEKDSTANNLLEYQDHFVKNYQDTVKTTSKDLPRIKQMAADSAAVIEEKIRRTRGLYTFTGAIVTTTGPLVLLGLLLSVIIAAIIASKKPR